MQQLQTSYEPDDRLGSPSVSVVISGIGRSSTRSLAWCSSSSKSQLANVVMGGSPPERRIRRDVRGCAARDGADRAGWALRWRRGGARSNRPFQRRLRSPCHFGRPSSPPRPHGQHCAAGAGGAAVSTLLALFGAIKLFESLPDVAVCSITGGRRARIRFTSTSVHRSPR